MNSILARIWKALKLPKKLQLSIMRQTQDQFLVGVTGIIFNNNHEVLLFKHTYRKTAWSLPGGYMKAKEHPKEAIEREIEEESGMVVSADDQLKLRTDRDTARLDICLIGKYMGGEFKASSEVSEAGFFSFDNLPTISKTQLILIEQALKQKKIISDKGHYEDQNKGIVSKLRKLIS